MHVEIFANPFLDTSFVNTSVTISPVLTVSIAPPASANCEMLLVSNLG